MGNSMEVPQKSKTRITIQSSNPTPGHISRENYSPKRYILPSVHSSIIHNSQDMETTYSSTDGWIEKTWYIYTMEYLLLIHKKEHINAMYSNTDTTTDDQTKSEGERQTWYHLYVEYKIWDKWTYLQNRDRLMDINNRLVVAKGEGAGEGMDWKVAVSRWTLLYRE